MIPFLSLLPFCQLRTQRIATWTCALIILVFHFLFFMRHTDDEMRRHGARVDLMDFFHSALLFFFFSLSYFCFGGVVWVSLDWGGWFTVCLNEIHTFGFYFFSLIKQSLLDWRAVFCFFGLRLGVGIIYQFDWQKGG